MIVAGPDFRVPPDLAPLQLVFILLALQTLIDEQAEYGEQLITLTSWYRDPMRNAAVGGREGSLHTMGLALDFTAQTPISASAVLSGIACGVGSIFGLCKERSAFTKVNAWRRVAPPFTQAIIESDHTHWELDLTP